MKKRLVLFATLVALLTSAASSSAQATPPNPDGMTAALTITSTSITVHVTATFVPAGQTFQVSGDLTASPCGGNPFGDFPFMSQVFTGTGGPFDATFTVPIGPLSGPYQFYAGVAANIGPFGTVIQIPFTTNTGSGCAPPPPPPPPPPPFCASPSSNPSNFNGTAIKSGSYIWFNSNLSAKGIPATGATLMFKNSTIIFNAGGHAYNLSVPNATITFSPTAACASTTFDTLTNTWETTLPVKGSDEIFVNGLAFPVPASFTGQANGDVNWSGSFSSNVPGVSVQWKWGAAAYSNFTTNYNNLGIDPSHGGSCAGYNGGDHAGTPEGIDMMSGKPWQKFVIGGARGGGGSNFTGSWSGTVNVPVCSQ